MGVIGTGGIGTVHIIGEMRYMVDTMNNNEPYNELLNNDIIRRMVAILY